ncbi:hypothetical protein FRB99_007412 [Tulasnella sp. 403]|nr:hypothetical protein FRB99_007412 [Tulasnella sp. 403]
MDVNNLVNSVSKDLTFALDRLPSAQETALARQAVQEYESTLTSLQSKIEAEVTRFEELKALYEGNISSLKERQRDTESKIVKAQAYLAPIRRLPDELLAEVFLLLWTNDTKKCGWRLSAVNRLWRRVALSIPRLWSTIELRTTTAACPAEIIRLWLERSGTTTPLDIDITLTRAPGTNVVVDKPISASRRRLLHTSHHHLPSLWNAVGSHNGHPHNSLSPPHGAYSSTPNKNEDESSTGAAMAWGYIVFDYLVRQLPRWRRFRFLFSAPFPSIKALDEIKGQAPLLEEFVVGSTDASFLTPAAEQWHWLPSADPRSSTCRKPTPNLRTLELRNVPFRYSSPLLAGLTTLKLVSSSLSVQPMTLNRVIAVLAASPNLKVLELNVVTTANILPLSPVTLQHLEELKLGGHANQNLLIQQLLGQLIAPSLSTLIIEVECRTDASGMAETLNNLLIRSSGTFIKSFSYGSGSGSSVSGGPYSSYHAGFPLALLPNLQYLEEMTITSCPVEPILQALASTQGQQDIDHPDDETDFGPPPIPPPQPINGVFLGSFGTPTIVSGGNGGPATAAGGLAALSNAVAQIATNGGGTIASNINAAAAALLNVANANNAAGNGNTTNNSLPPGFGPPGVLMTPIPPQNQFNDDYLCPFLRKLTFKHCHPTPDGVTKLIKMVEARNPDQIGGVGVNGMGSADASIPRRLRSLEFMECGHIGGDVIDWLEERIENVVYTESSCSPYRHSTPLSYPF